MDCSMLGSSVHGILQARTLEWVGRLSSRGSSPSRDQTHVSYVSCIGRWVLFHECHTWEAQNPFEKWKWTCVSLSCVWLFVTPWTVPYQAPPSMGFSRQEYQSGLPFPLPNLKPTLRSQTDDMKHVSFTYHWHHQMRDHSCYVWSRWAFWCLIWYTGTSAPGPDPPGWIQSSRPGPVCPCKNSPRGRKRHGPCVQSESEKNKHQGGDQVRSVLTLKVTGPPLFLL